MNRLHISKHRRRDDDGKWIPGKVRVSEQSGVRKLMRAARRGKMPDERALIIKVAIERAGQRADKYVNANTA